MVIEIETQYKAKSQNRLLLGSFERGLQSLAEEFLSEIHKKATLQTMSDMDCLISSAYIWKRDCFIGLQRLQTRGRMQRC